MEAGEIDVAPVHNVEGADVQNQLIQSVDVVDFSVGDMDEARDASPKIDQRVKFDGGLVFAEPGPREQGQTEIDCGRIESIGGLIQVHAKGVAGVKDSCPPDKDLGEVGVNAPVPCFVGIGQSAFEHVAAKPNVIEAGSQRTQTGFDIAKTFAVSELSKCHTEKLIET